MKKDFRISDNPALLLGLDAGSLVIPVFVLEPSALSAPETSAFHVAAWLEAIRKLDCEVAMFQGEVTDIFSQLLNIHPFQMIVSHEEIGTKRTFDRDLAVGSWCIENGIEWTERRQTGVFRGLRDRDRRAKLWKEWMDSGPLPRPSQSACKAIRVPPKVKEAAGPVPRLASFGFQMTDRTIRARQKVSEVDARRVLETFLNMRGVAYSSGISSPNTAFHAGSRLSVHLAWGTITAREVEAAVRKKIEDYKSSDEPDAGKWRRSLSSFLARISWRDHFIQRLESEPSMEFFALNRAYDSLPKAADPRILKAWIDGQTGFPLVDACIRCGKQTGFLNFRMRCMLTSVACHALHLHWKDIMWPMGQWWADYEPGIHVPQLQMQAGVVGINTLRTYNPAKQIADQDPTAKFVKRWIPELKHYSAQEIIDHQEKPLSGYLAPIVKWKASTGEMRTAYYGIKRQPETKALSDEVLKKHGSRKSPRKKAKKVTRRTTKKEGIKRAKKAASSAKKKS